MNSLSASPKASRMWISSSTPEVSISSVNKQIAGEMGVSEATVKMHRGNIMRKMHARSLADLVRMADLLGVTRGKHGSP